MATLDEALALVTQETTAVESMSTLMYQIKGLLDQALAGELTPAQQVKVDALFAGIQANIEKETKAVLDNTPQAPTP